MLPTALMSKAQCHAGPLKHGKCLTLTALPASSHKLCHALLKLLLLELAHADTAVRACWLAVASSVTGIVPRGALPVWKKHRLLWKWIYGTAQHCNSVGRHEHVQDITQWG